MGDSSSHSAEDILVRIWGMDANGKAFFQNVYAHDLHPTGATLLSIESPLKTNDVIGVQSGEKKARFKVTRVSDAPLPQRINAEVEVLEGQECPWKDVAPASSKPRAATSSGRDKRKFTRHKIRFPIELRDERGSGAHLQTAATDISGRGCYVELLVPFPLGTPVSVTFWIEQEKISTSGIVRASDPGVGMGIEFLSINQDQQDRFQDHLDKLDESPFGRKDTGPLQSEG